MTGKGSPFISVSRYKKWYNNGMEGSLKGKKILIAEDEKMMLEALVERFGREECAILTAEDGASALATALKEKPDFILLDVLMPKFSGTEVLDAIRNRGEAWGKKVPVIILTNLTADDAMMRVVLKNEPSFYLVKTDWKLDDIVNRARQCFSVPS